MKNQRLVLVVLGVCLVSVSLGQRPESSPSQKPSDGDVVRITTNLVQVDAVITDKSGKRSSMRAEDSMADTGNSSGARTPDHQNRPYVAAVMQGLHR
jgi:hypothetical protein